MTEPARISHDEFMAKIPEPYRSWKHDGVDIIAKTSDGRTCERMTDLTKDELIDALLWSYRVSCEIVHELRKSQPALVAEAA